MLTLPAFFPSLPGRVLFVEAHDERAMVLIELPGEVGAVELEVSEEGASWALNEARGSIPRATI